MESQRHNTFSTGQNLVILKRPAGSTSALHDLQSATLQSLPGVVSLAKRVIIRMGQQLVKAGRSFLALYGNFSFAADIVN